MPDQTKPALGLAGLNADDVATATDEAAAPADRLGAAERVLAHMEGPKQRLALARHARANAEGFTEPDASAERRAELIGEKQALLDAAQAEHDEHHQTVTQLHIDAAAQVVLDARAAVSPPAETPASDPQAE